MTGYAPSPAGSIFYLLLIPGNLQVELLYCMLQKRLFSSHQCHSHQSKSLDCIITYKETSRLMKRSGGPSWPAVRDS